MKVAARWKGGCAAGLYNGCAAGWRGGRRRLRCLSGNELLSGTTAALLGGRCGRRRLLLGLRCWVVRWLRCRVGEVDDEGCSTGERVLYDLLGDL